MANEYAEAARWIEAANFYKRNIEIFSQREREREWTKKVHFQVAYNEVAALGIIGKSCN